LRNGLRKVELRRVNLCGLERFNPHARAAGPVARICDNTVGRGATEIHELCA
jgi:hypothetical protein